MPDTLLEQATKLVAEGKIAPNEVRLGADLASKTVELAGDHTFVRYNVTITGYLKAVFTGQKASPTAGVVVRWAPQG
jgi:hypothetical protein